MDIFRGTSTNELKCDIRNLFHWVKEGAIDCFWSDTRFCQIIHVFPKSMGKLWPCSTMSAPESGNTWSAASAWGVLTFIVTVHVDAGLMAPDVS